MPAATELHDAIHAIMVLAGDTAVMPKLGKLLAGEKRLKSIDEMVTVADRDSEQILAKGLGRLLPEAKIVGEEAADADPGILANLSEDLCWVIDPLDGTSNFASGYGPFGILVALVDRGEPLGGWIYDPRSRRFCSAFKGEGARIDGIPVKTQPKSLGKPIAGISTLLEKTADGPALIDRIQRDFSIVSIPRCAAEQYPRLVQGDADVCLFGRTLPWDHAAGLVFLSEAGGKATRFDGSPYRLDDRHGLIVAASENLWTKAMKSIGSVDS